MYARVLDKLSYDIIGQVALIDRVKRTAHRYIQNEKRIVDTQRVNKDTASDVKESLSEPGPASSDTQSLTIASGCSGFEDNTDLVTQNSFGIVTAALQMQGGGIHIPNTNDVSTSSCSDHSTVNLHLGVQSTEQCSPVINPYDLVITTNPFNRSSTVGGVILGNARGARLAIERDISIADFPTVTSCLTNIQPLPSAFNNGLQVIAENIDSWRTNLVTRIKLYSSTIADLQTSSNATSYACDLNARTNSTISTRIDQLTERFNQLELRISHNCDNCT